MLIPGNEAGAGSGNKRPHHHPLLHIPTQYESGKVYTLITCWSSNHGYLSSPQPGVAGPSSVSSPQPMKDSKENLSSQGMLDHIKPCWYWDKKDLAHTPSQSEGLDPGTEARYRREGARFIFDVGTRLGLYP